jgi:hypothetical protein
MEIVPEIKEKPISIDVVKEKTQLLIEERVKNKKKPLKVHENIINGVSNKEYDGDFYDINKKIIDLKYPLLTETARDEMDSMIHTPQDPDDRSFKNLYKYIVEDKIEELMGDTKFASFFSTFKHLTDSELHFYNEYINKKS